MHDPSVRVRALSLLRSGLSNSAVARQLNVPAGTVSYWRFVDRTADPGVEKKLPPGCPRCESNSFDRPAYAYLLALYLGDGHIIQHRLHRVPSLSVSCAEDWPGLITECADAMRAVFPENSVCQQLAPGCRNVKVYSRHLWCLFPQHGPGRKHERRIALEGWQQEIVGAYPWKFIRGLIHSDGCRIANWTVRTVAGQPKRYEYPRYFFTNKSPDIVHLCCMALDAVGVEWKNTKRSSPPYNISVARRASVILMDTHVGPKF